MSIKPSSRGKVKASQTHNPETFVDKTLADASLASHAALSQNLVNWLREAEAAGLDEENITALFASTFQQFQNMSQPGVISE